MRRQPNDDQKPAGHAGGFLRDRGGRNAPPSRSPALLRRLLALALTGGALAAGGGSAAYSQVQVDGQPDAVHIEARDVTLREVLDALQTKFNLRYRTDDALEPRKTGNFSGSLQRVTARILDGYDFVMRIAPQGIDVLVLRQHEPDDKTVAAAMPARAIPKGSPAPVMTAAQANRYERGQAR